MLIAVRVVFALVPFVPDRVWVLTFVLDVPLVVDRVLELVFVLVVLLVVVELEGGGRSSNAGALLND